MSLGQGVPTPRKVSQYSVIASDELAAVAAGAAALLVVEVAAVALAGALVAALAGAEVVPEAGAAVAAGAAGWDEHAARAAVPTIAPAASPRNRRRPI
ncbi:MAG: hypothetical protein ACRDIY_18915 [Chloroflexota bacterium]